MAEDIKEKTREYLAAEFKEAVQLAHEGSLNPEDHIEKILLLDAVSDYLRSRNILEPNETFYWK
jgi:hypothetical protein